MMEGLGEFNLQSGFVFAVIILAVLFAERLGGSEEVTRRLLQVTLGITVALLVVSATTAFLRPPDPPTELESGGLLSGENPFEEAGDDDVIDYFSDVSDRDQAATTIHAGAGIVLVIGGIAAASRLKVGSMGIALGGVLLVLFGGVRGGSGGFAEALGSFASVFSSLLGSAGGGSSFGLDLAYFLVLAGGAAALLLMSYVRWDAPPRVEPIAASLTQQNMPE